MPMGKGYSAKPGKAHGTSSAKPMHGDAGGGAKTTMSSDKAGGYGAPGHAKPTPPWPRNPKQKDGRR